MSDEQNRGERLQIMLSPEELAAVDDFRFQHRMPTRAAAVRELQVDDVLGGLHRALLFADRKYLALADRKVHIDRILADDGRQDAAVRPDEIADRNVGPADPPGDRSRDVGVAELKLGFFERSLLRQKIAASFSLLRGHFVNSRLSAYVP